MDYLTKNKILFRGIIILVIINSLVLFSFVFKFPIGHKMPKGQRIMQDHLELTDKQAAEFEEIRAKHFAITVPIQEEMIQIKLELLDEIFKAEPDEEKIKELLATLAQRSNQFDTNLINHFRELKAACDEEQTIELKIMLTNLIESTQSMPPKEGKDGLEPRPDKKLDGRHPMGPRNGQDGPPPRF